jgi:hypothetical protein
MPSPFPGMDPFLEMEEWGDFHHTLMVEFKRLLVPQLAPKYVTVVERRVYLEHVFDELSVFQPDVRISRAEVPHQPALARSQTANLTTIEPEYYAAPLPEERHEPFLEIRDAEGNEVVTVIELLSPTNKARGSDGHQIYHEKREQFLLSRVNLVEVDLLRSGARPATTRPLPEWVDYCAMVHRGKHRGRIEVYHWKLAERMPSIPVPLANGDPDARLDLQAAFEAVYDASGYQFYLKYRRPLQPPARAQDVGFIQAALAKLPERPVQT